MANSVQTYSLVSVKATRTFTGAEADAIAAAIAMEEELQPAFGVSVECDGVPIAEIRDGINIDAEDVDDSPFPAGVAAEVSARRPDLAAHDAIAAVLAANPTLTADEVIAGLDEAAEEWAAEVSDGN